MEASYFEQLKSSVADMKNTGGRAGGSITAALFLKEFVKEGVQFVNKCQKRESFYRYRCVYTDGGKR